MSEPLELRARLDEKASIERKPACVEVTSAKDAELVQRLLAIKLA